jgi:hypothetical protein
MNQQAAAVVDREWSAGSNRPEMTTNDGDDLFPCACIHVDDHADAVQCWGVTIEEAIERRDFILRAVESQAELLAALTRLLDDDDAHLTLQGRRNLARAAIAKATGATA